MMLMSVEDHESSREEKIIIDCGATNHMVNGAHCISSAEKISERIVTIGDVKSMPGQSFGSAKISTEAKNDVQPLELHLKEALLVEGLKANLLSC